MNIVTALHDAVKGQLTTAQIEQLLEKPKFAEQGDIAFPCFMLAKTMQVAPQLIATQIAERFPHELVDKVEAVGGYVNFFMKRADVQKNVLQAIMTSGHAYGSLSKKEARVVIDFSAPNIAKPFSMGHLRSTVIGNALANITEKNGYEAVRINHIGDWGTQFGKLIVAFQLWGDNEAFEREPIAHLLQLYVRFHSEAEQQPSLNDAARAAFKALEDGHEHEIALWKTFKDASLLEFQSMYELLNVSFHSYNGEAFYNDKMARVIEELQQKGLLVQSDGAHVVELDDMPPCLMMKKDGATLYATRDVAAALYRQEKYKSVRTFYVVGNEQSLHFTQVFTVLEKMGYDWASTLQHISFGMMKKDGKKMSTRKGRVVLLKDVLHEAVMLAKETMHDDVKALPHADDIANQVGIGAVIFHDLKNGRRNDVEFSLEQMLSFEGETGPYVQYTYARIQTLLKKANVLSQPSYELLEDAAWSSITLLADYPTVVARAFSEADPSLIAKYALQLARAFNQYYGHVKILTPDALYAARLTYCTSVATVLEDALSLLGMSAPSQM